MARALRTVNRILSSNRHSTRLSSSAVKREAWTNDGIISSPYEDIKIPNCTLYDYVWHNLEKWPERTMAVCSMTGRGYTYEQAFKLSNAFGANLRLKLKIRDGDSVAIMLPNVPDYPLIAMGILEAGGVITTINPIYTAHEVHRQLLMSDAKTVVTLPELVGVMRDAFKLAKINIPIIVVKTNGESIPDGSIAFNELSEDVHVDTSCLKEVRRTHNDICFLPYSSGTTGLPKGVELTSRNIIANCEQLNEPDIKAHRETTASHQDVVMTILPFFHIYAATALMFHKMAQGIKLVTVPRLQPDHFMTSLEKHKANVIFVAPPLLLLMASHSAASKKTYQYLEEVINGAAPIASSDIHRFLDKVQRKIRFSQGYGLTETSPAVCVSPRSCTDYDSVGYPVPSTHVKLVDPDTLKPVGANRTGEVLVQGPQVMKGYRRNAEANALSFADGWFRTGDMGVADDSGALKIVDRLKELIKVKGFQVPPAELEAILRDHPNVKDAAVLGVPHPTNGEAPKAFVVLQDKNTNLKDICSFVNEKVAPFKHIDDVVVIDAIPKSAAGKMLKTELRAKYC